MANFIHSLASFLRIPGAVRLVLQSAKTNVPGTVSGAGTATQSPLWSYTSDWQKCEKRLALSAMPWGPLQWDAAQSDFAQSDITQSVIEWVDLQQHSQPGQIAHHEYHSPTASNFSGAELETFLAAAHQQTGWTNVQSQFGLTGQGQTVAIIDSGIAYNHVALGGGYGSSHRVVGGWDFAENDANPFDDAPAGYHGTHVAGIVGANQGAQQGVAPNVDFVALRTFTDTGQGQMAWVESALRWVYDNRNTFENPITTVNLSLGASWNSSTIPSWATLEDELMRLNQVGIVVVASAGNSFQQNPTPGLAYPAASPHVIPVASVDADGTLSGFSQRDSRVIAAPGRNVMSTVPDHFWGSDGTFTDWARASGTSMAAPYISGASVLIREAMELVGMENINTQSIYNTLMNTATSVFDPITRQTYKSLDLDNAIASILPADDIGSTLESARVQNIQSSWRTDSWINNLDDKDVLRLNAAKSGLLQFEIESEHLQDLSVSLLRNGGSSNLQLVNGIASLQITAGESIGFQIADGETIGRYGINWSFTESSTGNGNGTGGGGATGGGGSNNASPNLGTVNGSTLTINGTSDANAYELDLRQGIQLRVGDAIQSWSLQQIQSIVIDGGLNNDTVKILGTAGADKIELRAGVTVVTTEALNVELRNVESVQFDGVSGPDRAFLYDQSTDDRLVIHPNRAELVGVGYNFSVENVNRIFVHAVAGGDDQAFVYDSNQNDVLSVRPQFTSISGPGYFNYLAGFERVFAYSNSGGLDRAQLYDSAGDDSFNASPTVTSIAGPGFSTFARGFSEVEAIANAGGQDRAVIHFSGASQLLSSSDSSGVINNSRTSIARFFEQVQVTAVVSSSTAVSAITDSSQSIGKNIVTEELGELGTSDAVVMGPSVSSGVPVEMQRTPIGHFVGSSEIAGSPESRVDFGREDLLQMSQSETFPLPEASSQHRDSSGRIRLELVEERLDQLDSLLDVMSGIETEDEIFEARHQFFAQYR
ncbi:MAG: S8 family serine peptidase [Pirellula sp.]|nr:S8 family serine peptidase [Pirellula sp.]